MQSKDQLRTLKAENAKMPPPPPRTLHGGSQGSQPAAREGPATYHPDSQATRVQEGGITAASVLHSEPSVNKGGSMASMALGPPASLQASNALPTSVAATDTFQASTATYGIDTQTQREENGSLLGLPGGQSLSMEGSTAGELDDNSAEDAFEGGEYWNGGQTEHGLAASISSAIQQPWQNAATSSQATATFHPKSSEAAGPIPAGFFDDRVRTSKGAHPQVPLGEKKTSSEMDAAFAQFMQEVEEEAVLPLETEPDAPLDEDEDLEKKARDDFEQL